MPGFADFLHLDVETGRPLQTYAASHFQEKSVSRISRMVQFVPQVLRDTSSPMRFAALVLCLYFTAFGASAQTPSLIGAWQSDRDRTMAFAAARARLEDKTSLFLSQMMGRLTVRFTATEMLSDMPDWDSETHLGVKSRVTGFREVSRYRILGTTGTQVAILTAAPVTGVETITVYNFEDANTMWVYVGSASLPSMNIREYFRRVQ